jgi:hypothetical protein
MIPYSRPVFLADEVEDAKNTDVSEPLRLKDFSSWRSIPKLEKKYGEHKTLVIHLLFIMGFGSVGIVILYWVAIDAISTLPVSGLQFMLQIVIGSFAGSFGAFIINYRSVKKRLKKQQDTPITTLVSDNYAVLNGEQKFCAACGLQMLKMYCIVQNVVKNF